MSKVVHIKRRVRSLKATYQPSAPYQYEREDQDNGTIRFTIWDYRPESYRFVCGLDDDYGHDSYAKFNAEQIIKGLNLLVQYGMEVLPKVKDND